MQRGVRRLVDLGCGDFEVGSSLAAMVEDYTGVDVAGSVIAANRSRYASEHRRFFRLDLTTGSLPSGDAAVLRQVLQHLGNAEIAAVLDNVRKTYRLIFVTEHIPIESAKPNLDMAHGPLVRVMKGSGVFIDRPPFNVSAAVIGDIPYWPGEVLRTWVVESPHPVSPHSDFRCPDAA